MGIPFPKPVELQMDNSTAIAFTNNTCAKSKLKHIDCRQHWVQMLRNKSILEAVHIPSAENLADIFTKILPVRTFKNLRDAFMVPKSLKRSSV